MNEWKTTHVHQFHLPRNIYIYILSSSWCVCSDEGTFHFASINQRMNKNFQGAKLIRPSHWRWFPLLMLPLFFLSWHLLLLFYFFILLVFFLLDFFFFIFLFEELLMLLLLLLLFVLVFLVTPSANCDRLKYSWKYHPTEKKRRRQKKQQHQPWIYTFDKFTCTEWIIESG